MAAQPEGRRCRWKPELGTDGSRRWEPIGLERLLRLGRCRGKQRKWFGPGKRF
jgi:hypothetical protein